MMYFIGVVQLVLTIAYIDLRERVKNLEDRMK